MSLFFGFLACVNFPFLIYPGIRVLFRSLNHAAAIVLFGQAAMVARVSLLVQRVRALSVLGE